MSQQLPKHVLDRLNDLSAQLKLCRFLAKLGIRSAEWKTTEGE